MSRLALDAAETRRIAAIAADLRERLQLDRRLGSYQRFLKPVRADVPTLHLDDLGGIPFLDDVLGVESYQLRARVRAVDGDLYVGTCPADLGYERYVSERLQLGHATYVEAAAVDSPIDVAKAAAHGAALASLSDVARTAGGLRIHPYMGIEPVFDLARAVADSAGVDVEVLAPAPPVTWIANDKAELTRAAERACEPLGPSTVETVATTSVAALTRSLVELASRHRRVGAKLTRCASAMGNTIFESADIVSDPSGFEQQLRSRLAQQRYVDGDEVLATAWADSLSSPSTQLWIPPVGAGPPRLDGIYEQLLQEPTQVFVGSVPSRLGATTHEWLAAASLRVATLFQQLGYIGRCSFDFVVTEHGPRFVECNGRWGGTSTPMHLMDRLFPAGRPSYRAQDVVLAGWVGRSFADLEKRLGPTLYDPSTGRGSFILYNPGPFATTGKIDVIALGEDQAAANAALEDQFLRVVGD